MLPYGYALGDEAVHAFTALPIRRREKLLRICDHLARYPKQEGDFHESGATGRIYEIKLHDDLVGGSRRARSPHRSDRVRGLNRLEVSRHLRVSRALCV